VTQPEAPASKQRIPDEPRWDAVRRGLDQMLLGTVVFLSGMGLQLLLGDVPNRSRNAEMMTWGLIGLVLLGGGGWYLIGCFRCLAAPSRHRVWMIGYLTALGSLVLVVAALLAWLLSGAPIKQGSLGPVGISLFGVCVVATIAFIICLPYFLSSIGRAFGNEPLAHRCRFICSLQLLWYLVQVGLIISVRLEANDQGPKDLLNFGLDGDSRKLMGLVSQVVTYGSVLWQAIVLYQAQQTIVTAPITGASVPAEK
jgi:hypothetical protein